MAEMSKDFPPGLTYATHYDTTKFVDQTIHDVYKTLFEAGILVLIVIMVFLQNWRATLVPATTVPVTIIGAFAAMMMLGFGINLMTLFALILAIGIVVDDAIVIVENASYHIEQGLPPKEATIKAMEEMTGPVMGITLVLTAVFLPAAFLPGITGQLFRQFALVIASTAVISAINALTLKPAQCALWLRPHEEKKPNLFYRGFNRVYGAMEERLYGPGLPDGAAPQAHAPGICRHHCRQRLALRPPSHRLSAHRRPGLCHHHRQAPRRRLPAPGRWRRRKKSATSSKRPRASKAWVTIGGFSILDAANVSNIVHHLHRL